MGRCRIYVGDLVVFMKNKNNVKVRNERKRVKWEIKSRVLHN